MKTFKNVHLKNTNYMYVHIKYELINIVLEKINHYIYIDVFVIINYILWTDIKMLMIFLCHLFIIIDIN